MKIQSINALNTVLNKFLPITNPLKNPLYFRGSDEFGKDDFEKIPSEEPIPEPIQLSSARKISGIHCPVCGVKMLSKKAHRDFIENAPNIKDTAQLVEILNKNEDFIPIKCRRVLYDTKRIPDYKKMSVPQYVIALRDIANKDKEKTIINIQNYLNNYSQKEGLSDEHRAVILNLASSLQKDEHYSTYKKHLLIINDSALLDVNDLNEIKKNTMKDFIFVEKYCDQLNIKDLDNLSKEEVLKAFINNIFVFSRNHIHKIEKYDNHLNNPNNRILLCGECELRRGKNTFYSDRKQSDLKQNVMEYLRDIAFLNGSKAIVIPTDYLTYVCYRVNTLTKNLIVFDPGDIKYVTAPQNVQLRHETFAPILQSKVDIPCAECGSTMLPHIVKKKIFKELDNCKTLYDCENVLKKYDKYVGYYAKDIVTMFTDTIDAKPYISEDEFLDIFNKRVTGYLKVGRNNSLANYKKAREYYHNNAPEKIRTFEKVYKHVKRYIEKGNFDDYDMGKLYNECLIPIGYNNSNIKSVSSLLRDFSILSYKHSIVFPYDKETLTKNEYIKRIVYNIFASDTATADHLVAMNNGGESSKYNLIGMCKACNKLKSDKSVIAWYNQSSLVRKNLPHHLEVINDMAYNGELNGYDDWAGSIAETMYEETKGNCDIRDMFDK